MSKKKGRGKKKSRTGNSRDQSQGNTHGRIRDSKKGGYKGRSKNTDDMKRRLKGQRDPSEWPNVNEKKITAALTKCEKPMSSRELTDAMSLPFAASRAVSRLLKEMSQTGRILEVRPGRFLVSGAGGEHSLTVCTPYPEEVQDQLIAETADGERYPIHPQHRLGAAVGDSAYGFLTSDGNMLIVRIRHRQGREILGTLNFKRKGVTLIPDNRRDGDYPVLGGDWRIIEDYCAGDRVIGEVETDVYGEAGVRIIRRLDMSSPEIADFERVCLSHDLPGAFPQDVEQAATACPADIEVGNRKDCREDFIFTIDPETAKDFDDAISISKTERGWKIGVHIADVSHYVEQGKNIDEEASVRGTSIYLVNRVIPMLPEVLSNGLCSLVPHQDRYALSLFIELDWKLKIRSCTPAETVIHSKHRLSYEQALAVIEDRSEENFPKELCETILLSHEFAQKLRAQREKKGALNLFSVEHRFQLDVDGNPVEIQRESGDVAHQLIEEFMLLANRAVATWIHDQNTPYVCRAHGDPDEVKLLEFQRACASYGLGDVSVESRFGLQDILRRLEKEPASARLVLNFLCLRSFQKAVYQVQNIGHYALAFKHYAHFTSPIRRYPDLLVHRTVKRLLKIERYKEAENRDDYLDALAKQCSYLEQRAVLAERDLQGIKAARYLSRRIGDVFAGVVTMPSPVGLFVEMLETGLSGFVPMRDVGEEYYTYDPERMALVGGTSGHTYGIGKECDVRVVSVDISRGEVNLALEAAITS